MDWNPKDWSWKPRIGEGITWLRHTAPRASVFAFNALRFAIKAPLNIDRWNFRYLFDTARQKLRRIRVRAEGLCQQLLLHRTDLPGVLFFPQWYDLITTVRTNLFGLFDAGPAADKDGVTDIRGHYFAIGILVTALAALFTAPLALLKAYINERQTTATEQGLITDRITRAVEQLGAEKTVKHREREIRYRLPDDPKELWLILGDAA